MPFSRSKVDLIISSRRYGFAISALLIAGMTLVIYSNTFTVPFHFDDEPNIVNNYQVMKLSNFWPPSGMRYTGYLSFAINYHFGRLDVSGYHLVNIIIHIINGLLVWRLIILTFGTPVMERSGISRLKGFIALTSAIIFISHPVQTQAVTYIVQRFASLATLFYLLSLVLFIKGRLALKTQNSKLKTILYIALSILSAILAMKTKEISFTLPIVIALYEFIFFGSNPPSTPFSKGGELKSPGRLLYLIPLLITLLIIPLSMVGVNKPIGDIIGEIREASQETGEIPRGVYLLTQFRVIVTYIRLLFLPVNQNLDYDYPLHNSIFEPEVFLSFIFLLSIFGLSIYLFLRSRRMYNGHGLLVSFGILWFFITLSVESSIIPIRDVIFEHRLYLPGVGAVIAFSSAIFYWLDYAKSKVSLLPATCILLLVTTPPLCIATYNRNRVWKDEVTLWKDVVSKSTAKPRGYCNLGVAYAGKGMYRKGEKELLKALKLDNPPLFDIYLNLGNIYNKTKRFDAALKEFHNASTIQPKDFRPHYSLGVLYQQRGDGESAIKEYERVIELSPDDFRTYHNLGLLYHNKGDYDMAVGYYKKALALNPDYVKSVFNLAGIYEMSGDIDMAVKGYLNVVRSDPGYVDAYYRLGDLYKKSGDIQMAEKFYREAQKVRNEKY